MNNKYNQYLLTDKWRAIADECKSLANHTCNRCGSNKSLQAHHKTYDNVYNEVQEDLECLCRMCHEDHHESTSIKKLNKRICVMDLFTIQSKICKSSKDIEMFRDLLLAVDKTNELRINITKFSDRHNYKREYITRLLKRFVDNNLAIRIDRGVYLINPMVFQSIGSTNELIEKAQRTWLTLYHN